LGCAAPAFSANFLDPAVGCTTHTNTDLGIFRLGQNPLGVAASRPSS
jgi:hypothetical protein